MPINHRINQINIFGRMLQYIKKSEKGGFAMKKFKLFLAAILLMLSGCTNGNGNKGGSGENYENCLIDYGQKGELQNRGGQYVTEENTEAFLEMYAEEMDFVLQETRRAQRSTSIMYGISGYRERVREDNGLETTRTNTYYDFSRVGKLFFGGRRVDWTVLPDNPQVIDGIKIQEGTLGVNARLKFNGEFAGEIVYCNVVAIAYSCLNGSSINVLVSGTVKVNKIDITNRVLSFGGDCL